MQHVMSHFMAEDKHDFARGHVFLSCVPNHYAFAGTESAYVGVVSSVFFAGVHGVHAVARDVEASALDDFFDLSDQFGIGFVQRSEFKKQWLDHNGSNEHNKNNYRDTNQPSVEPP